MEMTLREVCQALGVTRRAIQGYEKANLVSASNRTQSGYLLYNESSRNRIRQIKLYQDMGFSIKEIQQIIDAPADIKKAALQRQKDLLNANIDQTKKLIQIIEIIIETL